MTKEAYQFYLLHDPDWRTKRSFVYKRDRNCRRCRVRRSQNVHHLTYGRDLGVTLYEATLQDLYQVPFKYLEGICQHCHAIAHNKVPFPSHRRANGCLNAICLVFIVLIILLIALTSVHAQTIETRTLDPQNPMSVTLGIDQTTTLLFPGKPESVIGLGLCNGTAQGVVQYEHPAESPIVILHPLEVPCHVVMTVLMKGKLYVFNLNGARVGGLNDTAITLINEGERASGVPKAAMLSPEEIRASRLKFDPEIMISYERQAHLAESLSKLYPEMYKSYSSRMANYTSDNGFTKTTVKQISRFSDSDTTVLTGTIENLMDKSFTTDGRATTVQVANETYPAKVVDYVHPIPPHATVAIDVVIQGDVNGNRSNISFQNEFRIMLPPPKGITGVWQFKNGGSSGLFSIPKPLPKSDIPTTQTGNPAKEKP